MSDNTVGREVSNTSGQAKIVTQHVPRERDDLYLNRAAFVAASGIKTMAPMRKLLKSRLVQEPRVGKAVEG